jgi:hypothetical protein
MSIKWSKGDDRALGLVLWLALALVGLFGVVLPAAGVLGGPFDTVHTREVSLDEPTRVPEVAAGAVTLRGTDRAELVFTDPDLTERVLLVLPLVAGALLLALAIELLRRIARTLRDGDVFVPENARRLTLIALVALVIGLVGPVVQAITTDLLIAETPVRDAVPFEITFSAAPVVLGVLVAALGEVFRRGTVLRADSEGLV